MDFICVNRYYGWYQNTGYLETIASCYIAELSEWKRAFKKPVLLSEYGAEAIAGLTEVISILHIVQHFVGAECGLQRAIPS